MFRRSEGSTAIEFALIAPILFLLLCSIFEYSLIMFTDIELSSGVYELSRVGLTGNLGCNPDIKSALLQRLYPAGFFNASNLTVESENFASFSDIVPNCSGTCVGGYSGGKVGIGAGSTVALYIATYRWDVISPLLKPIIGDSYNLTAASLIKNEPYPPGGC